MLKRASVLDKVGGGGCRVWQIWVGMGLGKGSAVVE